MKLVVLLKIIVKLGSELRVSFTKVSSINVLSDFIPVFIAKIVDPDIPLSNDYLFNVGNSTEIHIPSLRGKDPIFCKKIENYWERCIRFIENPDTSNECLTISRFLHSVSQVDTSKSRIDLVNPYKFLNSIDGVSDILDAILSPTPPERPLESFRFFKNLKIENDIYHFTLEIPGQYTWINELGGLPSPVEIARVFVVKVNYAKWRDRKVRRLVSIESRAIELWPLCI